MISMLPNQMVRLVTSVPLIVEYESVLKRAGLVNAITHEDIEHFLDYLCGISELQNIYYLWRPFLPDPFDDHILEVAVASSSDAVITYNKRDFRGIETFGLKLLDPKELLTELGELS